ncbi:MAG: hypothetical protein U5N27_21350 [Rhizobium sp.]|nr:hypothetical protein [Rhizobium sp.]
MKLYRQNFVVQIKPLLVVILHADSVLAAFLDQATSNAVFGAALNVCEGLERVNFRVSEEPLLHKDFLKCLSENWAAQAKNLSSAEPAQRTPGF